MDVLAEWLNRSVPAWVFLGAVVLLAASLLIRRRSRLHKRDGEAMYLLGIARRLDQLEDDVEGLSVAGKLASGKGRHSKRES
jgi:hypothetical protein